MGRSVVWSVVGLAVVVLGSVERATAADPDAGSEPGPSPTPSAIPSLPDRFRGETVKIEGNNLRADGLKVALRTGHENEKDKDKGEVGIPLDAQADADGKSVTFKIPKDGSVANGRYLVVLRYGAKEVAVPGELRVLSDQVAKVHVDSMSPATVYRSAAHDGYDFVISGENLAREPRDNEVDVVGRGPQAAGTAAECDGYKAAKHYQHICLSYEPGMETRKLMVTGFQAASYEGMADVRLKVRGEASETKRLVFSRMSAGQVRGLALAASVVLAFAIFWLLRAGIKALRGAGGPQNARAAFFLDRQTDSYSLSKFQLLAWTAVAVYGYLYVFCCRMLIQWTFEFPGIPAGWPTLLGLSGGATVAAAAIMVNRGPQGAGASEPTLADFITSGGIVMSDRFQFFIWTIVGCLGALALLLWKDPSTLSALPEIPDGLLFLMGISAAGYLGGKLVRLPGPVISQLFVSQILPASPPGGLVAMIINLKGENLSREAKVCVDNNMLLEGQYTFRVVKSQDNTAAPSFCCELELTLKDANKYLEGSHELRLENKDGQMAAYRFPLEPFELNEASVEAGNGEADVVLAGRNFDTGSSARWKNPGGVEQSIDAGKIVRESAEKLIVKLTPGTNPGTGRITLISSIGFRASADVTVRPKTTPTPASPPLSPP